MGIRGIRNGCVTPYSQQIKNKENVVVNKEDGSHRKLCLLASKWLKYKSYWKCPYVATELVVANAELPDVFGWNYYTTILIEVKVSRSDFLADSKKPFRVNPNDGLGELRYYCCPKDLIREDELPEKWGLLYEEQGKLQLVKEAQQQISNYKAEKVIYTSILRREGVKPQIFDYRKQVNAIGKSKKFKTFDDLIFKDKVGLGWIEDAAIHPENKRAVMFFPNGYGVLVLFGKHCYSNGQNNYELRVLIGNRDLCYLSDISVCGNSIHGYIHEDVVTLIMAAVQKL